MKKNYLLLLAMFAIPSLLMMSCKEPEPEPEPEPETEMLKDYDGNVYTAVKIGKQWWMVENLKTTHYADGTSIGNGGEVSSNNPRYYYPGNDSVNKKTFGLLYNWHAVMNGAVSSEENPSGVQGICPKGWHVPSDAEWTELTDYVSSQPEFVSGSNAENIGKALASKEEWAPHATPHTIGSDTATNNGTKFNALPAGGFLGEPGGGFGAYGYYWTATKESNTSSYSRDFYYDHPGVYKNIYHKNFGFSVRCVKN